MAYAYQNSKPIIDAPAGRTSDVQPYEVHTPVFEGPLPLLLHLIEEEELDITQVALAKVTDQFLDYVEVMRRTEGDPTLISSDGEDNGSGDLRRAGKLATIAEFLSVAAHLMLLKSRVLLPKPPAVLKQDDVTQEDEIEDELVRQLRAYRQYKEAAQWLRERNHAGLRAYVGVTAPPKPQHIHVDLTGVTAETLREAAQRSLYPQEGPRPQEAIQRPRISVVQQIHLIRDRLKRWKQVVFQALLNPQPTRLEAVVTLQAILELVKQRVVQAVQPHPFGEILISEADATEATRSPDEMNRG